MGAPVKRQKTGNSYSSYAISGPDEQLDVITDLSSITPESFFAKYIRLRKPVKFDVPQCQEVIAVDKFGIDQLVETLAFDEEVQVEKKHNAGFGSGQKRVKMTLEELIDEIKNGSDDYYKTTQYDFDDPDQEEDEEDDDDEEEEEEEEEEEVQFDNFSDTSSIDMNNLHDDFEELEEEEEEEEESQNQLDLEEANYRVKELYQPPLTNLLNHPETLPIKPSFFNLIPQQINIWLGSSGSKKSTTNKFTIDESKPDLGLGKQLPGKVHGSSSGLHHDHADNLYVLIQGKKRFTIYCPKDALKLYTIGKIHQIYNSGIIDYEVDDNAPFWKHVRDDGAIVEEILHWQLEKCSDDDEEQKTKLLDELQTYLKQRKVTKKNKSLDPPSFSQIPPALLHLNELTDAEQLSKLKEFAEAKFPGFLELNKLEVWLDKPGQMLYLPAGWFHEVSSFGNDEIDDQGVHIAINYWFIPPNKDKFDDCYEDEYWTEDWKKTKEAISLIKE